MADTQETKENTTTQQPAADASKEQQSSPQKGKNASQQSSSEKRQSKSGGNQRGKKRQDRGQRGSGDYDYNVVDIRRVTRVVAGGRRFSFRVTVVAGNHQGKVGVGVGKAGDTPIAIDKAFRDAKANMIEVRRTADNSIPCEIEASFCGSHVLIMPSPGRGVIAGSTVRPVIELAGLNDVTTKLLSRSKNKLNNARVAVEALTRLPQPKGEDAAKETKKTQQAAGQTSSNTEVK